MDPHGPTATAAILHGHPVPPPGGWLGALWLLSWEARTALLLLALVVVIALLRTAKVESRRGARRMTIMYLAHAALLPVAALLLAERSEIFPEVEFLCLLFAALTGIAIGEAFLFDILAPLAVRVSAPRLLRDLVFAGASVVAMVYVLIHVGADTAKVFTTTTLVTAVVGFSLQDTLGNIMGGLALQLDNSVQLGDWIKVNDPQTPINGRVVEIRWRYTAIETRNWETIIVPNSVLMRGQVLVLGRRQGKPVQWRRWVWFNVDFRSPPSVVIPLVEQAIRAAPIERVSQDPPPNCVLMDLADSYGRYAVRYWLTDLAVDDPTDSVIRTRLYFALKRAGISPSIPAQQLFVDADSPERRGGKAKREHEARMRALAEVDLLSHLEVAERERLADGLIHAPFTRGETLTRQGAEAHWLYMVTSGECSVHVEVDGIDREVTSPDGKPVRLGAGNFFGEMGLMTGAPRAATVVALTDVDCYRLDKHAFEQIIRARPELANEVALVLARRRVELEAMRENLSDEAKRQRIETAHTHLLDSIRDFFGLEDATSDLAAT